MGLAEQLRPASTQALSSNMDTFVSPKVKRWSLLLSWSLTVFLSAVSSAQMGKSCPVFAVVFLGAITASALEVQPLTQLSLFLHHFLHLFLSPVSPPGSCKNWKTSAITYWMVFCAETWTLLFTEVTLSIAFYLRFFLSQRINCSFMDCAHISCGGFFTSCSKKVESKLTGKKVKKWL